MRAPDIAYAFVQPKDVSGPTLEATHRRANLAAAATLIVGASLLDLPIDRAFVLTNATARGFPDAGNRLAALRLVGTTPALNVFEIAQFVFNPALINGQQGTANWQGELVILGAGNLTVQCQWQAEFTLAAQPNSMISGISGYTIPRANIANG